MKIVKPSYKIIKITPDILEHIEECGRTAYMSHDRTEPGSAEKFVMMIIKRGHESVLEHAHMTVRLVCDRGVSHELVRHRLASYTQESTRYCDYSKDKNGGEIKVIMPDGAVPVMREIKSQNCLMWQDTVEDSCRSYLHLIGAGHKPQIARSVLPTCLATTIVMSSNIRHWREVLRQRTAKAAHPQMREIMIPLLAELKETVPVLFDDIEVTQ